MLVVLAAVLFMFVYQPPGAGNNDETVTLAGREPDRLGLNLNPTIWGRYFIGSERALPFRDKVAYVSLFAVFVGFIYARRRRLIEDPGAVFSLIVLLTYGLLLMLFIKHTAAPTGSRCFRCSSWWRRPDWSPSSERTGRVLAGGLWSPRKALAESTELSRWDLWSLLLPDMSHWALPSGIRL